MEQTSHHFLMCPWLGQKIHNLIHREPENVQKVIQSDRLVLCLNGQVRVINELVLLLRSCGNAFIYSIHKCLWGADHMPGSRKTVELIE